MAGQISEPSGCVDHREVQAPGTYVPERPDLRLELRDDLSLFADDAGRVLLQTTGHVRWLVGLGAEDARRIFPVVKQKKRLGAICAALEPGYDPASIERLLHQLSGTALRETDRDEDHRADAPEATEVCPDAAQHPHAAATPTASCPAGIPRVLVMGSSDLARELIAYLGEIAERDGTFQVAGRPGCSGLEDAPNNVLFTMRRPPEAGDAQAADGQVGIGELAGVDLLVYVSTETVVGNLLAVERACLEAGTAVLFVTGRGQGLEIGPTLLEAGDAGPACVRLHLDLGAHPDVEDALSVVPGWWLTSGELPAGFLPRAAHEVGLEVSALTTADGTARSLGAVGRLDARTATAWTPVPRRYPAYSPEGVEVEVEGADRPDHPLAVLRDLEIVRRPAQAEAIAGEYRRIGILGGGTAGYLTALALRARRPELEVTLIESSKIPVIGVGEATTSEMPPFLHQVLGFDVHDFTRRVRPTFKLGIRFEWGSAGSHFNYPFDSGPVLESQRYDGHLRNVSLLSVLMDENRGPLLETAGGLTSLLPELPFAYHLENRRFVAYLQEEAKRRGVRHLDCVVVDAEVAEDGETVEALLTDDGRRLEHDLYVDCSGFRSLLMGQKLGSRFIDYDDALFTDTAVVAEVPHGGTLKPYTTAECMDHGWCWNIPQVESDHRGYVFSSSFCSAEDALREMRRKNPGLGEPWTVKFRSGRREHFWKGNVVAMGNAYGFVEPLESTALQVLVQEIMTLVNHLPAHRGARAQVRAMNRSIAGRWDYIRDFLAVHYRFNRRFDSPFWRACRADVQLGGAAGVLELYRQGAPLVYQSFGKQVSRELGGLNFNNFGFDVLLFGQGVAADHYLPARWTRQDHARRRRALRSLTDRALPQARCLDLLRRDRPELLDAWVGSPGWMSTFARELEAL